MNTGGARRSSAQLWILVGVFFAPLLFAFLLYYGGGWRPAGSTHRGELIHPARPLPRVELPTLVGAALTPEFWRGKWTLVYVDEGRCDERCREALTLLRQTRLALNSDMARVQRVFLATGNCCDRNYLDVQQPGLAVARVDTDAGASLLAAFPDALRGWIYIVDPLGNLMMRHAAPRAAPNIPSQDLLEDLKRLLKLSHIG